MYVNLTPVNSSTYGTKTKQQALETRQHILDVAMRLFSQQGVSATSLAQIAQAAGVTRGAIYWHFKDKSDLFGEIWELSESSISDLESEYRAKFPHDPLSVLREILVYILEATVVEERRRLMMEIIFHKCEFVGEMAVVQQAQRDLCLESYDRIEQVLTECMQAKMLPATLLTRRAAILMRSYISGLMENWLLLRSRSISDQRRAAMSTFFLRCASSVRPFKVSITPFYLIGYGKIVDPFRRTILLQPGVISFMPDYFRSFLTSHSQLCCTSIARNILFWPCFDPAVLLCSRAAFRPVQTTAVTFPRVLMFRRNSTP